jgi:Zn-finger nucleic acid-binding protein
VSGEQPGGANVKKCPVDGTALRKVKYEFTSIWQCPECLGTFLTDEHISKLIRKQETTCEQLSEAMARKHREDTAAVARCPACNYRMEKRSAFENAPKSRRGGVPDFRIDVCPGCKSIWLDGGELEKLELDFQQSSFGTELGRHYKSYSQLSGRERQEYIRAVAASEPDRNQPFFSALAEAARSMLKGICEAHGRPR